MAQAFGPVLDRAAEPAAPRLNGSHAGFGGQAGVGAALVSRGIEQANLVLGCGPCPGPMTAGSRSAC